jgi:hypothetical protein
MAWPSNASLWLASRRLRGSERNCAPSPPSPFTVVPQTLVLHHTSSSRWGLGANHRVCAKRSADQWHGLLDKSKAKQDPGPLKEHLHEEWRAPPLRKTRRHRTVTALDVHILPRTDWSQKYCTLLLAQRIATWIQSLVAPSWKSHRTRLQHLVIPSLYGLAKVSTKAYGVRV